MATMVVLCRNGDGAHAFGAEAAAKLARLGVTHVSLVRDADTVGFVVEGWAFDPARSEEAVVAALAEECEARTLRPVAHLAVSAAYTDGGSR